jgi:hypothetical protein
MDSLKHAFCILFAALCMQACGPSTTYVDYVETDTYLSATDSSNHAESKELKLSLDGSGEERVLLKIPTGKRDVGDNLSEAFKNPLSWAMAPFVILAEIFAEIFDCRSQTLAPALLTSAKLVVDVTSNASGTSLSNQVSMQLVARPWWQDANWTRAHGFSQSGAWQQAGGDLDSSFAAAAATHVSGPTTGTLEFDMTSYFRSLLTTETAHYGMELKASAGTLQAVKLASAQNASTTQRPRLVTTYNCITPTGSLQEPREHVFYLDRGGRR